MHVTQQLAEFVCARSTARPTPEAREAALRCLLDLLASAAAGFPVPAAVAARRAAPALFRGGKASVWFAGQSLAAAGAAFCNAAAASALDLDDGNRLARGHPGAAVIPAALATAEETSADAEALLAAIVTGYDVAIAVAAERGFYARSGLWCGYGAVAAAAALRGTPADRIAHALAISGATAPNLLNVADGTPYPPSLGNDVKEGIPWATASALAALKLAEAGSTGPLDLLDHAPHHRAAGIAVRLAGPPAVCATYFKFHCCCRHVHAPIEALLAIMAAHALPPQAIEAVEVHTYRGAFNLSNRVEPANLVDVQYSISYCLGLVALDGAGALLPLRESVLHRPEVSTFARKISLHLDPAVDSRFPAESLARVVVTAGRHRIESPLTHPRGEANDPPSWQDLEEKLRLASAHVIGPAEQERLLATVGQLRDGQLPRLVDLLAMAAPREQSAEAVAK
jgi:2-methylcitrate dehydratase PrpD